MSVAGLRERKKLETQRSIVQAARELVHQRGVDAVTVDEIAEAAGVSSRTFFNYFSCKEAAVVATDPALLDELGKELLRRPAQESPVEALRAVLIGRTGPPETLLGWQLRHELVAEYPRLLPRHLAATAQVESVLTRALAERAGIDPARDPRVRMLVAAAIAATREAVAWWYESDRSRSLLSVLDDAFDLIAPVRLTTA